MLGLLAALQVKLRVRKAMCARARAARCSDAALCLGFGVSVCILYMFVNCRAVICVRLLVKIQLNAFVKWQNI